MSLNIVKNNTSSPFLLQRSIVDQGGAYESGGYNPDATYKGSGLSEGISAMGEVIGAGIGSVTTEDKNKFNVNKEARLAKKDARLTDEWLSSNGSEEGKILDKLNKVSTRRTEVRNKISDYENLDTTNKVSTKVKNYSSPDVKEKEVNRVKQYEDSTLGSKKSKSKKTK